MTFPRYIYLARARIFMIFPLILLFKSSLAIQEITLSQKKLSLILDRQEKFFTIPFSTRKDNEQEMTRNAQEIVASYESYLSQNPDDTNALILFGKFLRKVGQEEHAVEFFIQADKINPKLAVVKQQLANYLVEKGRPIDAFPYYILTIELNPKEAFYHFHLGNFLFLFEKELIENGILNQKSAQSFMHRSFREASMLRPNNFEFQLRYAQSFFDFPQSNKADALNVLKKIEQSFPNRSNIEKDYFRLCRARILLELNRQKDASQLIKAVSSQSLIKAKEALLLKVNQENKTDIQNTEISKEKQSFYESSHRQFIPTDPHLERLRKLTKRLVEEKMLSELKSDAVKARFDSTGQIKIELTNISN